MSTYTLENESFTTGCIDVMPLVIAVAPWGILCGAMAIEAGLSPLQAQAMSLLIFGGAVQLAGLGLLGVNAGFTSILSTSAVISSRHLLYSAAFRQHLINEPRRIRWPAAFLLTDEMFALTMTRLSATKQFDLTYSLVTGFVFYVGWNISSFVGIVLGSTIPDLTSLGLEFIVACMFIAMVVPQIQSWPVLLCVTTSGISATYFSLIGFEHGLIISGILGMLVGYNCHQYLPKQQQGES